MKNLSFLLSFLLLNLMFNCNSKEENQTNELIENKEVNSKDSLVAIQIDSTKIPKSIEYKGNFKNAVSWNDESGENFVILSATGIFRNADKHEFDDSEDSELFAYHFNLNKGKLLQVWKLYDFVKDCPVDIDAEFYNQFPKVTDLNKNDVPEIWIMYKTGCHGDVSPVTLKLIMYEGNKKYAMRGENKVQVGTDNYLGGEYKFDKSFNSAPDVFKNFAIKLWKENIDKK